MLGTGDRFTLRHLELTQADEAAGVVGSQGVLLGHRKQSIDKPGCDGLIAAPEKHLHAVDQADAQGDRMPPASRELDASTRETCCPVGETSQPQCLGQADSSPQLMIKAKHMTSTDS